MFNTDCCLHFFNALLEEVHIISIPVAQSATITAICWRGDHITSPDWD
jgi:hypothetical protein